MTVFIVVEHLFISETRDDQQSFRLRRVVDVFDTSRAAWDFVTLHPQREHLTVIDRDVKS